MSAIADNEEHEHQERLERHRARIRSVNTGWPTVRDIANGAIDGEQAREIVDGLLPTDREAFERVVSTVVDKPILSTTVDTAKCSDLNTSLAGALAQLQQRLPDIVKSETAEVETKTGRKYSYTYANLTDISRAVLPLLGELGMSFIAKPTMRDGRFVLAYSLLHISGEREDGEYPLPANGSPQELGSAITYGRRYCLCSVTGVAPDEDDDAVITRPAPSRARKAPISRSEASSRPDTLNSPPGYPKPGAQEPGQQRKVFALWRDLGYGGEEKRAERLGITSKIIGHEVSSTADLDYNQMSTLIQALQKRLRDTGGAS